MLSILQRREARDNKIQSTIIAEDSNSSLQSSPPWCFPSAPAGRCGAAVSIHLRTTNTQWGHWEMIHHRHHRWWWICKYERETRLEACMYMGNSIASSWCSVRKFFCTVRVEWRTCDCRCNVLAPCSHGLVFVARPPRGPLWVGEIVHNDRKKEFTSPHKRM